MKVEMTTYAHASNGLGLQLIPETDVEERILRAFWTHGKMEMGHPGKSPLGNTGFFLQYKLDTGDKKPMVGDGEVRP